MEADALVIGAGPAGLAVARELNERKVKTLVLERSAHVGDSFRRMHDGLTLLSPARFSGLPGMRLPLRSSVYPTRDQFVAYLDQYRSAFDITVTHGTEVTNVERRVGGFSVQTNHRRYAARVVVVASGQFSHPYVPPIPGIESAEVPVLHAAAYRNPVPYSGQRVLVVGSRNTAAEIALELAASGVDVSLSVRRPLRAVPRRPLGLDVHHLLVAAEFAVSLAPRWRARVVGTAPWVLGRDILRAVRIGDVHLLPSLKSWRGRWGMFESGTQRAFDAVILATGYRYAAPFLRDSIRRDVLGVPVAPGGQSNHPGLYFIGLPGMRGPASAFLRGIGRDAPHVAECARRHLARRSAEV